MPFERCSCARRPARPRASSAFRAHRRRHRRRSSRSPSRSARLPRIAAHGRAPATEETRAPTRSPAISGRRGAHRAVKLCVLHPARAPAGARGWAGRVDGEQGRSTSPRRPCSRSSPAAVPPREHAAYDRDAVQLLTPVLHPPSIRVFEHDDVRVREPGSDRRPGRRDRWPPRRRQSVATSMHAATADRSSPGSPTSSCTRSRR